MALNIWSTIITLFLLTQCLNKVLSANILHVAPLASPSHHLWNRIISKALVERGHNVTMLTHDKEKEATPQNWTVILLEGVYEKLWQAIDYVELAKDQASQKYMGVRMIYDWQYTLTPLDLETEGLKTLLNYPKDYKFDLVIFDPTANQVLYPLIDRFGRPPVVAVTPFLLPHYLNSAMGNHIFPSYMPHYMSELTNSMSFVQRFHNFMYSYYEIYVRRYEFMIHEEQSARKYFGNEYVRPLHQYEDDFAVLLCNYDPLMEYGIALPPNIIPVGGLHARPGNKLPEDLQHIFDTTKEGIILFTLGTNLKSDQLDDHLRQDILSVFGKLNQTVIWKFETDIIDLPKNVIVRKWLPQNDMMAHSNLRLLITHGGALTTQEAMYHGIPVVVIPFFVDQIHNAQKMVSKKLGRMLKFSNFNKNDFYEAIKEVINNPIYGQAARKLSLMIKDQPQKPLDRAIHWIERILKYGTIHELRLPAASMTFVEIYNLDIIFILFCVVSISILLIAKVTKKLICGRLNIKPKLKTN